MKRYCMNVECASLKKIEGVVDDEGGYTFECKVCRTTWYLDRFRLEAESVEKDVERRLDEDA